MPEDVLTLYINLTDEDKTTEDITIKAGSYVLYLNGGVMNYE